MGDVEGWKTKEMQNWALKWEEGHVIHSPMYRTCLRTSEYSVCVDFKVVWES